MIDSSNVKAGELKSIFDALEEAFNVLEINFYIIGAMARDIWYAKNTKAARTTKDVDFAVFIASEADYNALGDFLVNKKNFTASTTNSYVMISPEGLPIDLLPFGAIEIDDQAVLAGEGLTSIRVNGFKEVYQLGTVNVDLETGHSFEVATLPAIVLLKMISFGDRPLERLKDPNDIGHIIRHYFHLESERIYDHHSDVFGGDEQTLEEIAAKVIGREIKLIIQGNEKLIERILSFLSEHIALAERSSFVRNMKFGEDFFIETALQWLVEIEKGIIE